SDVNLTRTCKVNGLDILNSMLRRRLHCGANCRQVQRVLVSHELASWRRPLAQNMLRNIGSNWLLLVVSVLATYFLVPFNIKVLGADGYGLWLIIAAVIGYLSLFQLGVPMASVRHLTSAIASRNFEELNRVVVSCAVLYLALGIVVAAVGLLIERYFAA